MSHYAVLVIGDYPESQLEPFDENLECEAYYVGDVSEADKEQMLRYYNRTNVVYNTFEECYREKGGEWNGKAWRLEDGVWREYSTYNPDSKWDWYQLGGRWSGRFIKLKEGASGSSGGGSWTNSYKGGVDQAYKKDIDFDAIKRDARNEAIKTYRECAKKCGGCIPHLPLLWKDIIGSKEYYNLDIDRQRELYHSQEAVKCGKIK